jgi:hypothetical protein
MGHDVDKPGGLSFGVGAERDEPCHGRHRDKYVVRFCSDFGVL